MAAMESRAERRGFQAHTLTTADQEIHYWMGGTGPPLVLIHGFGGDGLSSWRHQLPALAAQRTVVVPDLQWFGRSAGTVAPTLEAQAQAQLALLDHLGWEQTDVVAVSYGGFVVFAIETMAPGRLQKVVLVDTPGPFFSEADQADLLQRFDVHEAAEIFLPADAEAVGTLLALAHHDQRRLPGWVRADIQKNLFSQNRPQQRALLEDLMARRGQTVPLDRWTEPLVIWGAEDRVFSVGAGQALATGLGGQLVVLPEAAHSPATDQPEAFNQVLLDYLLAPSNKPESAAKPAKRTSGS